MCLFELADNVTITAEKDQIWNTTFQSCIVQTAEMFRFITDALVHKLLMLTDLSVMGKFGVAADLQCLGYHY